MSYKSDDLLYGFMRNISSSREEDRLEYLPIRQFQKVKKVISQLCGYSPRQINSKLVKLQQQGLLGERLLDDEMVYVFPYDYEGRYKIINKEMLTYLINTRNGNVIRIYLYLLNKYEWRDHYFTIGELKRAMGYSDTTKTADQAIKDVLESLRKEGIIDFEKVWCVVCTAMGKSVPTERYKLNFVAKTKEEF